MRIPRPFALCAIVCAIAALVLVGIFLRPVVIANSMRNEVREFREGPFPAERLRKWATDHSGRITCSGSKCEADATVYNRPLHAVGLAPEIMLAVVISTDHGALAQTSLYIYDLSTPTEAGGAGTMLFVHFAHNGTYESKMGAHGVHVGQEPFGKRLTMVYSVDLNAESHATELAYGINVWCLARIGGCSGPQQAPEVWALRKQK